MKSDIDATLEPNTIAQTIDHTLLKPEATRADIERLLQEALDYSFYAVCIHPTWVPLAVHTLKKSSVKVATVIGFPHGATFPEVKAYETYQAVQHGVEEVDMVINIGALKSGELDVVRRELDTVIEAAKPRALVKVIIETALLTDDEKRLATELAVEAGADFVKTSTGFSGGGATLKDVRLLKDIVGERAKVKASGGIRDLSTALRMLDAGAARLGTSSGVAIMHELLEGKTGTQPADPSSTGSY